MFSRAEAVCLATVAIVFAIPAAAWWIERLGQLGIKASMLYRKVLQHLRARIQRAVFDLLTNDSTDHPDPHAHSE
ncbi:hypothetical protein K1Y78_26880 [Streptomyces sp. tea 10]|nr:hypothetical protein [Streptomyces sp. tea 10]